MKFLSIIRHAKTETIDRYPSDFDRELTTRGQKDALRIGSMLATVEPAVDWIFSSSAVRARTTAELIAQSIQFENEIVLRDELYAEDPEEILRIIGQSPALAEHVAVVAHNPTLEIMASALCASNASSFNLILTPGTIAHIAIEIARWDQLRWGAGRLEFLVRPKLLRSK